MGADEATPAEPEKSAGTTPTEDYDPETGEVKDPAPKKVNRQKPAPAPKKEDPAPQEPVTESEPVTTEAKPETEVQGISSGDDERKEPAVSSEPSPKVINLRNSILKDIEASGSPDAVEDFYKEQLEKLQVEAPDVHAELQAAFEAARA
jgi:hypothetical protein